MSKTRGNTKKKISFQKNMAWLVIFAVVVILIILPAGGFTFAAIQESKDPFCGSCHTQPESTYLQNSVSAQPVDLASYHTTQNTRFIDCHSGRGLGGRLQTEFLGATNAIKWYSGTAVQPAPLTHPIGDGNCLKCHDRITEQGYVSKNPALVQSGEAQNGHWHVFLSRWQSPDSNAATCVSCHGGHTTDGDVKILYLNEQHTTAVCDARHQKLGED
jgi:cytochrome c553